MTSPQSKTYREYKARLQEEWRGRIFERDGYRCRACGREGTERTLHLAHITSALRFVREAADLEGMDASYREDNLVAICSGCHKIQHRDVDTAFNPELSDLLNEADEMRKLPEIQAWLALRRQIDDLFEKERRDAPRRGARVKRLFEEIQTKRDWRSPQDLRAGLAGIPSWQRLGYQVSARCYAPSGGPKKRQRVALGFCTYEARTCLGPVARCGDCRLPFCAYHVPKHRRR